MIDLRPRRTVATAPRTAVCAGLVIVVVGTFLPWLRSGRATRNSYATGGAVRRLLDVGEPADAALRAWPFVSLVCAAAVALVLLHLHRIGFALAIVAAIPAGAVAAWALTSPPRGLIHPATTGPLVTAIGAALTVLAVVAALSWPDPSHRSTGRDFS